MRRKILGILSIVLLLTVTVACGNTTGKEDNQENATNNNEVNAEINENEGEAANDNQVADDVAIIEEEEEPLEAEYEINRVWSVVPLEDANEQVVLLTIDDAPDNNTLEMAQTLHDLEANAIFFVNGHLLETPEKKAIIKEIHELGFVIGNHTYGHKNLRDLSEADQRDEIISVNDMVEEITGERPRFFRAPFGANTDYATALVEEEGMTLMNWSYGYDWNKEYTSKEPLVDIMINTEFLRSGANLLMHDRDWTAAAIGDIVVGLRDKGYEMVDPRLIKVPHRE